MGSIVTPVTTFADVPAAWLDHLDRRTRSTVGARCARADLVVLGEGRGGDLEVTAVLLSAGGGAGAGDGAGAGGRRGAGVVSLPPPSRDFDGSQALAPSVLERERALVFAVVRDDGPPAPIDGPGAVVGEETSGDLERQVAAVRWYAALPTGDAREAALLAAAEDGDPAVVSSALRALADERRTSAVEALEMLADAPDSPPVRGSLAATAMWVLGARDRAERVLGEVVDRTGRDRFRRLWGVREVEGDETLLVAPDPQHVAFA
ncbi:hypothetical protein CTKZ_20200 [Cellulomonas algicola]|uniref:HEAT repeat domain-containing protein n=1 Tax=Cellulomonas algicola TaxID=2071633 RepID=A0A401V0J5_9CELL|nr:hypothetical protein [Cellulomonas algicola]GCD20458.1 hypothetical protein CTKZ_20200 [Cellulomonas algicola]